MSSKAGRGVVFGNIIKDLDSRRRVFDAADVIESYLKEKMLLSLGTGGTVKDSSERGIAATVFIDIMADILEVRDEHKKYMHIKKVSEKENEESSPEGKVLKGDRMSSN